MSVQFNGKGISQFCWQKNCFIDSLKAHQVALNCSDTSTRKNGEEEIRRMRDENVVSGHFQFFQFEIK